AILEIRAADSGAFGRAADRLHELQLPPRSFRHHLGPADRGGRGRPYRLRRLRHGPAGAGAVRHPRDRAREMAGVGARSADGVGRAFVMPGPVPGIHVFRGKSKTWMAGTSPAMTNVDQRRSLPPVAEGSSSLLRTSAA